MWLLAESRYLSLLRLRRLLSSPRSTLRGLADVELLPLRLGFPFLESAHLRHEQRRAIVFLLRQMRSLLAPWSFAIAVPMALFAVLAATFAVGYAPRVRPMCPSSRRVSVRPSRASPHVSSHELPLVSLRASPSPRLYPLPRPRLCLPPRREDEPLAVVLRQVQAVALLPHLPILLQLEPLDDVLKRQRLQVDESLNDCASCENFVGMTRRNLETMSTSSIACLSSFNLVTKVGGGGRNPRRLHRP
ncbi:hypothetical protein BS78_K137500 [Paspalum vaginatum]|uniref:Uncharacterized protein n=1 Tax=Paspalum vaginatum TaxID=158149 RepID=A0A9W7XCB3_9POAL|nr:hypothetical protein BS78_K137500 [Paspalum vaginatum]